MSKQRLIDANALKEGFLYYAGRMTAHAIAEQIDKAPTINPPEWISVDDRMPEKVGLYLICRNGKVECAYRQNFLGFSAIWNNDLTGGYSIIPDKEVTHWMPLPEAPKGGDKDA